jgi:opacity protein-like surface antigen
MRRFLCSSVALILSANLSFAADLPQRERPAEALPSWNWSGIYFGAHVGGSLGFTDVPDPLGSAIYGGSVRTPSVVGGLQVGVNWMVAPAWLIGAEIDASALNGDGTNTCFASSGAFSSANCRVRHDAMATLTGRAGVVTGPNGKSLFYAKGGAAYLNERIDVATNPSLRINNQLATTSGNGGRWGWTIGAGVEQAVAPALSVKLEYDYANFGSTPVATPQGIVLATNTFAITPAGTANASLATHQVKLGLNMKLGGDAYARWDGLSDYHLRGALRPTDDVAPLGEIEVGGRVWYSSGRFQKDLGSTTQFQYQGALNSRLTYQSTAASAELFGRLDGTSNVFLKGFAGGGKLLNGKMNDEDWIPFQGVPYSNTVSDPVKGNIGYATIDVGYNIVRGSDVKVGGFVGYNFYRDDKLAYGCVQLAGAPICNPAIDNTTLVIGEDNRWHSLRVGLNGVITLADGLKLTADAAYLPYAAFTGVDNHVLRTLNGTSLSPESGSGQGVQLEAILSYAVSRSFSVGAGGRYWAMWANNSDAKTNYFGLPCPCQTLPVRAERYGGFIEASYKFDASR